MQSIRTLMHGIVDYAGLFPPARLDMASTVQNYARFRDGPDAWMLGRLIVPVARFDEFEREAASLLPEEGEEPWSISAITAPLGTDEFRPDLNTIDAFNERLGTTVRVDTIETRATDAAAIDRDLGRVPEAIFTFAEVPVDHDCRGQIAALSGRYAAAKVRTGGVTPEAFPAIEHLAAFLHACAAADVPFKATAGLHHPFRHRGTEPPCMVHGFMNVFVAAGVARRRGTTEELAAILESERRDDFRVDETGLGFGPFDLSIDDLDTLRERFALSFGSCSFDEPLEDLRDLDLLGAETPR